LDQNLLAVPQSFSQRATSFIASWCQGIHRMPFCRSIFCSFRTSHDVRCTTEPHISPQNSNEILQLTHHAQEPSIGTTYASSQPFFNPPLGTEDIKTTPMKIPKKLYPVPARNSCNIHGHHNRNHCIIIHLNTRNFCNYSSWLTPLPRSDNPLQKTRTKMPKTLSHPQQFSTRIQTHQNLFTV
jgi:hypothetical protein